jgi:trigger factor
MKTQVEKVSNLERKLNIEVPITVVNSTFDRFFKKYQKNSDIKGFRKGKAPIDTVKGIYGDRVRQEVIQELLQVGFSKGLNEHDLSPVNYPNFEFDEVKENENFSFTAAFEVGPEVQLKQYEGLELLKEEYKFEEAEVDKILERIRTSQAKNVPVLEDRPAQVGDVSVIDFEGFIDGKPLENGSAENFNLELGAKSFIEGFEEGVIGMKVGSQKTLALKFPENYQPAELAGKAVDFKVTLKTLNKKELPELTDELVKSLGGIESLEALRNDIKKDIEQTEKRRIESEFKDNLFKKLVDLNPVDVPPSLVAQQKEGLVKDFEKRSTEQGMSKEEFEDYVAKWDKDFEKTATEILQAAYISKAVAEKHELLARKEDIENKIKEYTKTTGIEEKKVRDHFLKPEMAERFIHGITEEKVYEFILSKAKVTEVTKAQMKKN